MKEQIKHIGLLIVALMAISLSLLGQAPVRYVQNNSTHALSVPDNPDYSYEWTVSFGTTGQIPVTSDSSVTHNIRWPHVGGRSATYTVTVLPIVDSVGCYGEPVMLQIITVDYLSLFLFDDVYFTDINTPVSGDVSENDFDESGANIYYNPTPVQTTQHGTLEFFIDGTFNYVPNDGFTGTDYFIYEAFNDHAKPMYSTAKATIVVRNDSQQADLYIEKTGPAKALYGQEIEYTIMITNFGPNMAENVVLEDNMTFGLFNPKYRDANEVKLDFPGRFEVGNLAPGDSVYYYLYGTISLNSPKFVYNQAITWADTFDPYHLNNDSIWITEVSGLFVDLPGHLYVPGCETKIFPGESGGLSDIVSYKWEPATGLDYPDSLNPIFTPDDLTRGKTTIYVLNIIDRNGDKASDTLRVTVSNLPLANIEADTMFLDMGKSINISASESYGDNLTFWWSTSNGHIVGPQNRDSLRVDSIGTYQLEITDYLGCTDTANVVVMLKSHPPETQDDYIALVSGFSKVLPNNGDGFLALANTPSQQWDYLINLPDSNVNVLLNDFDINDFDLKVSQIITPPDNVQFTWDQDGDFFVTPNEGFVGTDRIQYQVCNNGYPVNCNTAWLYINVHRPPLNADVAILKTGDEIAFWGDTIHYEITVWNNGPDTVGLTTITDVFSIGLFNPEYSLNDGLDWEQWMMNRLEYNSPIYPDSTVRIMLRAAVRLSAPRFIDNKAWVETNMIENNFENDTSTWRTKIKEKVIAFAGNDTVIGSCAPNIQLDAYSSTGENLEYSWSPQIHLEDHNSPTPVFINPGASGDYTYTLTITDDDGISDEASITIRVLPPPLAIIDQEFYQIAEGDTIVISARRSTGVGLSYQWSTTNGHIVPGTEKNIGAIINEIGIYQLVVTDAAGCKDSTSVEVTRFYYDPFAIPDYYSTTQNTSLNKSGNESLLYNDYDPNGFTLSIIPETALETTLGGSVDIQANGNFQYTPPQGINNVDGFEYTVCSDHDGQLRCDVGYVRITINQDNDIARLNIQKIADVDVVLVNDPDGMKYRILITNEGPISANNVVVTDVLSKHLGNARYRVVDQHPNMRPFVDPNNEIFIGNLPVGDTREIFIYATALPGSPGRIFNAATVTSRVFDDEWLWDETDTRNVDTVSVLIESNLLARAELVELFDNSRDDHTIGYCDKSSYLSAERSGPSDEIDDYEWSPREYLTNPDAIKTTFIHPDKDTTITFTLTVSSGTDVKFAYVDVHFSRPVFADAGPDRKVNVGATLVIDATRSGGAGAEFEWKTISGSSILYYSEDNVLMPVVNETGVHVLTVTDMHGCEALDTVTVRENDLVLLNDIVVTVVGVPYEGNFITNDYDPEGDEIYFTRKIHIQPSNGTLPYISEEGDYIYVPNPDFVGIDFFDYEVCDNNDPAMCKVSRVYINVVDVDPAGTPPVANHDHLFVNPGTTLQTNILANDFDIDGGEIYLDGIEKWPSKGGLSFDKDGNIIYTPYAGVLGTDDYFEYRICDNGQVSLCTVGSVKIDIHKISEDVHRPVAADDAYFAVGNVPIRGNVLLNDFDPDGDEFALNIDPVVGAKNGEFRFASDASGDFIYTPNPGFEGTDQVVYEICETRTFDPLCDRATINIVVLSEDRYYTDLAIFKDVPGDDIVVSGGSVAYKIDVSVEGPTLANNVIVVDTLDSRLFNAEYSLDSIIWQEWTGSVSLGQMFLYDEATIYIRADIPNIFEGDLVNVAWVDHNMNETNPSDNNSEVVTEVFQRIIANAGNDTIIGACYLSEFAFDVTGSLGPANMQFKWEPVEHVTDPEARMPGIVMEPGEEITFTLLVSDPDGLFNNDTAQVTVKVDEALVIVGVDDVFPDNTEPVFLDGGESTGAQPITYLWWMYDENDEVFDLTTDIYDATIVVERSGYYYFTITDKYGCKETKQIFVGYKVEPFVAVDDYRDSCIVTYQQQAVDIYVLRNDIIDINDDYVLETLEVIQFPENGYTTTSRYDSLITYTPDIYFTGIDSFVYIVSTRASDPGSDFATVCVNVIERPPVVPEGFSPNGDNINDYLLIENIELYEDNKLVIFSRWGNIVYEKERYSNSEPWDGVANRGVRIGRGAVPTGVYYFVLYLGNHPRLEGKRHINGNMYIATDNRR